MDQRNLKLGEVEMRAEDRYVQYSQDSERCSGAIDQSLAECHSLYGNWGFTGQEAQFNSF